MTLLKKLMLGLLGFLALAVVLLGGFAFIQIQAFDGSVVRTYDVPLPTIERSSDPQVLERGKHLAESLGACFDCHGSNGATGKLIDLGPLATVKAPSISTGKHGTLAEYTDAQLARLIKHGVKRDGKTALFMPSRDFAWWPSDDVVALISYLRTLPSVDGEPGQVEVGAFGKVLDRLDMVPLDIARRIDHEHELEAPAPSETKEYGAYVGRLCTGCHGESLSGGRIPGAPPDLAVPLNITPHETGIKGWSLEEFKTIMRTGVRKNGQKIDPFMPMETMSKFNDVELGALYVYLQSVPAKPFGNR